MSGLVRRGTHALVAALAVSQSACGYLFTEFEYDRESEIASGEVRGQAVRADFDDKPPAPYARVIAQGAGAVRRASSDGQFTFRGLVPGPWVFQVEDDVDGDGWPERSSTVSAFVRAGPKPSGLFGEGPEEIAGVLLGRVPVDGTTRVKGQVLVETASGPRPPSELGLVARVLVTRDFDLPTGVTDVFNTVSLGAEAQTAADSTGTFVFPSIGSGTFQVVAFLFENPPSPTQPGRLFGATAPVELRAFAGDPLDVTGTPLLAPAVDAAPLEGVRDVQVGVAPAPEGQSYLVYVPQGREAPPCEPSPPESYAGTPFPWAVRTELASWGGEVSARLPYGVFDVYACTDEDGGPTGVLYEVTVPVPEGDPQSALPVVVGPLLLSADDRCQGEGGARDCDGDALKGLAPFSPASSATWSACVAACQEAFGEENAGATCTVGEETFDCDDDGDGQPDVTEAPACYGIGRGTDLDGDGLCSGQDPFPQCRANNADACVAGEFDFMPTVPPEFGGNRFDTSFGNDNGFVVFGGEGKDEGVDVAVVEDDKLIVVGTLFNGSVPSAAVWRVTDTGELDESFGSGGVVLAKDLGPVGPSTGAALAVDPDTGDIWVAGTAQDGSSTDLLLFGLSAEGVPLSETELLPVNLGADEQSREEAADLLFDGGLWLVGAGVAPGQTGPAINSALVCAFDPSTGALDSVQLGNPSVPGCVYLSEGPDAQRSYASGLARLSNGRLGIVGHQGDEAANNAQAWYWELTPGEAPEVLDRAMSPRLGSTARQILVTPQGVHVAGTDADEGGAPILTVWRDADGQFEPLFATRGGANGGAESYGYSVAADASGGLYVVGETFRSDTSDLLAAYYDANGAEQILALHDSAAGGAGHDTGRGVAIDGSGRVVVVGTSASDEDNEDKTAMVLWRLLPANDAGAPPDGAAPDAGPPPDGGGSGGQGCARSSDCNDTACDGVHVPVCLLNGVCGCEDVCDPESPSTLDVGGELLLQRAEDLELVPAGTICIVGDVRISGYSAMRINSFPSLRRVAGSVFVEDPEETSLLRGLELPELFAIDGSLDVLDNTQTALVPVTGLDTLYLPSLRRLTQGLQVIDNRRLETGAVVTMLEQLVQVPELVVISGNGCDADTAPQCHGDETCAPNDTFGVDICALGPSPTPEPTP